MTKATARISNFAAWIAAWMFLGGGLTLRSVFLGKGAMLELSQWGLWLTPLMLLILGGDSEWRDLSFVRRLHRLWPYFGRNSFAAFLMISAGCLHFFAMMARHYSFQSEWDLSIYANACAHGLQSSLRNHTSLLADHFEPGLFLLAPACAAMNPVVVLLLAQSIAWSLGSWGIRKLALLAGWSPSLATIGMCLYLLFAGNQTVAYYDFHPYAISLGTIPWMVLFALQRRYTPLILCVLLHLSLKEHTGLFVAFFGAWLVLTHRNLVGWLLAGLGAATFVAVMIWAFPYFRHGQPSEYLGKYYGYLGNSWSEWIQTVTMTPQVLFAEVFQINKLGYLIKIFAPFAFIHLIRPVSLVPIIPAIGVAVLSNSEFMYSGNFHYEAEIYSWLFVAAILLTADPVFLSRWKFFRCKLPRLEFIQPHMLWLGVMIAFFSGSTPQGRISYYMPSKPQIELAVKLSRLSHSLQNCKVATVERLSAHLAAVPQLTMLSEHAQANAIVLAYPQGAKLWIQDFKTIEESYVPMWEATFQSNRPLNYDQDFRVWTREGCSLEQDPMASNWR